MAAVTFLSGQFAELSFLLFPPLAAGTYTLFSDPEGRFASPRRFVGGLTVGAVCGLVALNVVAALQGTTPDTLRVDAGAAALAVLLVGAVTWGVDLEEPAAYSTALLVPVTRTDKLTYVLSVTTSSILVAGVFLLWRDRLFERRGRYLYTSIRGDDRVLVPVRRAGDVAHSMIDFATRLAGDRGRVSVCHCIRSEAEREAAERMLGDLAETASRGVETRIAREEIQSFLERVSGNYDLVVIGSSSDRSAASRFVSRPTFERIEELDCDFAVLDRNFRV